MLQWDLYQDVVIQIANDGTSVAADGHLTIADATSAAYVMCPVWHETHVATNVGH